nr:ATP-binding protein [Ramlibacter paludis]
MVGAESTGKTQLARELADHFGGACVAEVLREWCAREGRTPRPEELLTIALEHERRVEAAAASSAFVVSDAGPLMVAIYGGLLFADHPLFRFALERQAAYGATLVTGLDLPWVADGLQRDAAHPREEVDALVRDILRQAAIPFQVVYGQGADRLQAALAALGAGKPLSARESSRTWSCEKCSDPECEHRLFRRLGLG